MSTHEAVLLLGSNLGDRKKNLEEAVRLLKEEQITFVARTDILQTDPVEFASSNYFCNFAAIIRMKFSPMQLLKVVNATEQKLGRSKDSKESGGYMDRVIDIDIVSFNNLKFLSGELTIPHERHLQREFSVDLLTKLKTTKHKL